MVDDHCPHALIPRGLLNSPDEPAKGTAYNGSGGRYVSISTGSPSLDQGLGYFLKPTQAVNSSLNASKRVLRLRDLEAESL
jgi:hypothetical protein